jgi:hypothetical protein
VDETTTNSFSIFDAGSVDEARQKLKANIDEAVNQKSDPAERVASIGKPGESQEANAERIRHDTHLLAQMPVTSRRRQPMFQALGPCCASPFALCGHGPLYV